MIMEPHCHRHWEEHNLFLKEQLSSQSGLSIIWKSKSCLASTILTQNNQCDAVFTISINTEHFLGI